MIVLFDSGPLGILTNPKGPPVTLECQPLGRIFAIKRLQDDFTRNSRL
jgi:hypothetical protein